MSFKIFVIRQKRRGNDAIEIRFSIHLDISINLDVMK